MRILLIFVFICILVSLYAAQNDSVLALDTNSVKYHQPICCKSNFEKGSTFPVSHFGRLQVIESIAPIGLVFSSAIIINFPGLKIDLQNNLNWDNDLKPNYINLGDDYVRYAPAVAAYALSACGLKSKHRFIDRTVILAVSFIASDFVVHNMKNMSKSLRPGRASNSTDYSLPSQHTAMAFVGASFLDHELGYISPWISVGGYAVAGYVGYARIARNRHWTSDVLFGAAVGLFATNATYWAYDGVMKLLPKNLSLVPIIDSQQKGMYFCYQF